MLENLAAKHNNQAEKREVLVIIRDTVRLG